MAGLATKLRDVAKAKRTPPDSGTGDPFRAAVRRMRAAKTDDEAADELKAAFHELMAEDEGA